MKKTIQATSIVEQKCQAATVINALARNGQRYFQMFHDGISSLFGQCAGSRDDLLPFASL